MTESSRVQRFKSSIHLVQKLERFGGEKDGSRISERNALNGMSLRGMNHTVHTEERNDEAPHSAGLAMTGKITGA